MDDEKAVAVPLTYEHFDQYQMHIAQAERGARDAACELVKDLGGCSNNDKYARDARLVFGRSHSESCHSDQAE